MELRYKYRIYPDNSQKILLNRTFGCARVVYNSALALKRDLYAKDKSIISDTELQREIVTKNPNSWMKEAPQIVLQQSVRVLFSAYKNFFGGRGRLPRFKRNSSFQSIKFTRNGFKLRENGSLYLSKIGSVKMIVSRTLPSIASSVTIIRDSADRFYASFVVSVDVSVDSSTPSNGRISIDLGITNFLTTSDGEIISNPKFLKIGE